MNQSLYTFLGALGFTDTTLDERIRSYLLNRVATAQPSDTNNDLWMKLGTQGGYGATIQQIQMNWAIAQGSFGSTWSDILNNLLSSPLLLFQAGEQGAWYDPYDMTTLFQDSAGTIPVTASGQVVGRILDKSGRGNHATQPLAASKPIFRDVGGLRYLEFDGADDFISVAGIDFTATDAITIWCGARKQSDAAIGTIFELSADINLNNGVFALLAPRNVAADIAFRTKGTLIQDATGTPFASPISFVAAGEGDISSDRCILRINGAQVASSVGDQGAGNYGNYPLYIGRRGGVSLPFNGNVHGMVLRGSATADLAAVERLMVFRTGVTL